MKTKLLLCLAAAFLVLPACDDAPPASQPESAESDTAVSAANADADGYERSPQGLDPAIATEVAEARASVNQAAAVATAALNESAIQKAIQDQARLEGTQKTDRPQDGADTPAKPADRVQQ